MGACLDAGVGDLGRWPQSSCFDLCPSVYLDAKLTSTHLLYYEVGNLTNLINTYWIVIAIQLCSFALYFYYLITSHLINPYSLIIIFAILSTYILVSSKKLLYFVVSYTHLSYCSIVDVLQAQQSSCLNGSWATSTVVKQLKRRSSYSGWDRVTSLVVELLYIYKPMIRVRFL